MKLTHIADVADKAIENLEKQMKEPEKYRPIPTGIEELDKKIFGIRPPQYVGVLGKAKKGKSTFAQHLAAVLSSAGRGKTCYFLLEEVAEQLGIRMLVRSTSRVDRGKIYRLELDSQDFEDLRIASQMLREQTDFYVTDEVFTVNELAELAINGGYSIIVIDYAQLLSEKEGENEAAKLTIMGRKFVQIRNVHNITLIVVYQLNDEDKILNGRAALRDADILIKVDEVLDSQKVKRDGILSLEVIASRVGAPTGQVLVAFDGAHNRIYSRPPVIDIETMLIEGEQIYVTEPNEFLGPDGEIEHFYDDATATSLPLTGID